jgi:predicted RNase H-like HicB family nuclease
MAHERLSSGRTGARPKRVAVKSSARPEDNGTFVAFVPAIPGCHAWGQTPDEAQTELMNVFEMIEEEYKPNLPEKLGA